MKMGESKKTYKRLNMEARAKPPVLVDALPE